MLKEHVYITFAIDKMQIDEIISMMTGSRAIQFSTAEMIKNKTKSMIIKSIQQIIDTYCGCRFRIKHILRDQQFKCIRQPMELQSIDVNITRRDEHVPEVE